MYLYLIRKTNIKMTVVNARVKMSVNMPQSCAWLNGNHKQGISHVSVNFTSCNFKIVSV